jgi:hypothetical protein
VGGLSVGGLSAGGSSVGGFLGYRLQQTFLFAALIEFVTKEFQ